MSRSGADDSGQGGKAAVGGDPDEVLQKMGFRLIFPDGRIQSWPDSMLAKWTTGDQSGFEILV